MDIAQLFAAAQPGTHLVSDTRVLARGDIFCALRGNTVDGHELIAQAIANGASAVVWEQEREWDASWQIPNVAVPNLRGQLGELGANFYAHPSKQLDVVAVTGTKGKTTVAAWCAWLLNNGGRRAGYIGTLGSKLAAADYLPAPLTTPQPLELQRLLAKFVDDDAAAVVLEASSHALVQDRLAGVACDVAVFTNLGRDHLEDHGSMAEYFDAKCQLFIRPELTGVVINQDDPHAAQVAKLSRAEVLYCGSSADCHVYWQFADGEVVLRFQEKEVAFKLPVPGTFNASNAALAVAAALLTGMSWESVTAGLTQLPQLPGRLQKIVGREITAYVDYAHTPEALQAALTAVRSTCPAGKLICVFGCGGLRDKAKRPQMGAIASQFADHVIITNDNPRTEEPQLIANEIVAGMADQAEIILERRAAIAAAVALASPGDVLLVAGKGHETTMEFAKQREPFDDVAVVTEALAQ